jgi:DEAD/DEAH box helicase domain-containing protein
VGGRSNIRKLGMSAAVTYSTASSSFHRYTESRVKVLLEELRSAELVVGFNVVEFDYEVLRGYVDVPFENVPTLDMMDHLARRIGFRVSLDSVATATLRVGKSGDGLQAIRWYRQGLMNRVLAYCQQDVELTKKLHEYGKQFKVVYYWDKQYQRQMAPVSW